MMRTIIAIVLIALGTLSAHVWTQFLLRNPAVEAFVNSDRLWLAVFGVVFVFGSIAAACCAALVFHPGSLPGRRPEGGE
ncbi:hypothetical protein NSU_0738 [Novosphingobium pentaromativorans US6-1]|uniref:Uncharacterized protein n=2 Tax=Novosphingobium pentaromativorans TaxID=205844 RepID=G6E8R8_9SPHN|nr:hypothetical protein NSU_0738 [Novosphingobium pentaromativorans US6-1]